MQNSSTHSVCSPMEVFLTQDSFFRQYIEGIDAYVYVKDCESRYVFINRKAEDFFGISREALAERVYTDAVFFDPVFAQESRTSDLKVIETGESIEVEDRVRFNYQDNSQKEFPFRYFTTLKFPLRNDEGDIIGIAGFSHETTERRQVDEEVRLAFQKVQHLETSANIGFWSWSLTEERVTWSDNLCRLYGITPESFDGTLDMVLHYTHPEDLEYVNWVIDYLLTEQQPHQFFYRIITPDGHVKHLQSTTQLHFNDHGRLVELTGSVSDVSELRQTELALWENQERLSMATKAAKLGLWDWNVQTGHVVFNEQWASMLGYKLDELPPSVDTWEHLLNPEDKEFVMKALQVHLDGISETYNVEFRLRAKNGGWYWVLACGKVVERDAQNCPIRMVGIHMDIMPRKAAEEELLYAYEKVERTNTELKEMHSQVVQSEKMASIGQLAAGVAHEMNTPVGFVASNFQTLKKYMGKFIELLHHYEKLAEQVESGSQAGRLETLQAIANLRKRIKVDYVLQDIDELFLESAEGLERVTSIITNLKDFSRVDQAEAVDEFDVNMGIKATLVVVRNEIKYDADVEMDLGEIPPVKCNSGQINQVILNLLVNASHAIKGQERDSRGKISIKTTHDENHVICQISDDGPGVPPEIRTKIFDPFFTTKPAGKGTGLGLSVSYDIVVNKHKGELSLESELGQGTTFTIRLPRNAPQQES